jgi:succinyl-CoA synthetase beta subunit
VATSCGTLSESESKQLIAAWGVPVTREVPASSAEAAVEAADRLGYPVALKVDSPDIPHKTEAGAVRLGAQSAGEVRRVQDGRGDGGGLRRRRRAALSPDPVREPGHDLGSQGSPAPLLRGFRGRPPADVAALADTLVRVAWLAMHLTGHLAELDINPLMVLPAGHGVKAVDALAVLPSTDTGPRAR